MAADSPSDWHSCNGFGWQISAAENKLEVIPRALFWQLFFFSTQWHFYEKKKGGPCNHSHSTLIKLRAQLMKVRIWWRQSLCCLDTSSFSVFFFFFSISQTSVCPSLLGRTSFMSSPLSYLCPLVSFLPVLLPLSHVHIDFFTLTDQWLFPRRFPWIIPVTVSCLCRRLLFILLPYCKLVELFSF